MLKNDDHGNDEYMDSKGIDDNKIKVDRIANHPAALLPSTARLRRFQSFSAALSYSHPYLHLEPSLIL